MDLTYSDEQNALRETSERVVREAVARADGVTALWGEMARLGWSALLLPEADGGIGGTAVDASILAESLGRHLATVPYITRSVLAGTVIAAVGDVETRARLLPGIANGSLRIGVAVDGVVLDADGIDQLLLFCNGRVHLLHIDGPGLSLQTLATVDGRTAARVTAPPEVASAIGPSDHSAAVEAALDTARAVLAADMVGAMHGALDATVAYAKTREQFGQPIGANQVVKHRLVNMAIKVEEARSLALLAAVRCSDGSPENVRARAVSSAKVQISALARAVTEDAVQLHGAMGVTDELQIGDALKRAIAFEASYGTSRWHRTRYAALRATRETA